MAVYDAQLNNTARNTRQYTDLDLFFGKKSSNSDIQTLTDVQAVKRSIRNLVQLYTTNLFIQRLLVVLERCYLKICLHSLHTQSQEK